MPSTPVLQLLHGLDRVLMARDSLPVENTTVDLEFPIYVRDEDLSDNLSQSYGPCRDVVVRVRDKHAIFELGETRVRYRYDGVVDRGPLYNPDIFWSLTGEGGDPLKRDAPEFVTLAGYEKRKRQVWREGGFVDDPAYDRGRVFNARFQRVRI